MKKSFLILFTLLFLVFLVPSRARCDIGLVATYPHAFQYEVPPGTFINGSDLYMKLRNTGDVPLLVNITSHPPFGILVYLSASQIIIDPGKEAIIRFAINVTEDAIPGSYSFDVSARPVGAIVSGGGVSAITLPAYAVPIKVNVRGEAYLLTVVAVDPIGTPIRDVIIQLYYVVDDELNQITEQRGELRQRVIPGTYHIIVRREGKILNQTRIEVHNDTNLEIVIVLVYFTEVSAGYLEDEQKITVTFYFINNYRTLEDASIVWERTVDEQPVDSGHIATWAQLPVGRYGPFTITIDAKYGLNRIILKFTVGAMLMSKVTAVVNVPKPEEKTFPLWAVLFIIAVIASSVTLGLLVWKKIRILKQTNRRKQKSPGRVKTARRRKKRSSSLR